MEMQALINRINELSRKSKTAEGLTQEEKEEQTVLRNEYRKAFMANLGAQLDSMSIKNPDGSITKVKKK
ncbi:MAG: DUF896 domain-containing protein [Clostridia bacterium]|nr:DUF896 domain-containing protein [Clostridia bacterium]